ncbi:hypothetical protein [Mesonia maritima]|uniref:Lipocalin-like domain-containing protein n=1 Tax=Mesonia maritima TaxID=1793873 RepID=A0ABU1K6L7_9FLAO|nr:hypothetical protein [Mesonia maritima]MDR6300657.1 hypothetical protein [Mesonia maritima]
MRNNKSLNAILIITFLFCFNTITAQDTIIFYKKIITAHDTITKTLDESGKEIEVTTTPVEDKNIDWEKFDKSSTIAKDKIKAEDIEGLWKAYEGLYRFYGQKEEILYGQKKQTERVEHINKTEHKEPVIIEVKGNTFRRNSKSDFEEFYIKDNMLISKKGEKHDIGIINKITPKILTISWKDGDNYTRYFYKK